MRILLTNDDGIHAQGLIALAQSLSEIAEVSVVAPAFQQSGTGHGITVNAPIRAEEVEFAGISGKAYMVFGLPTDCVKIGLEQLLQFSPDLVISGINHGANLGTDVLYSGTVSAGLEGYIAGVPALALSLATEGDLTPYLAFATDYVQKFCLQWQKNGFLPHALFNINFPALAATDILGSKYTSLGMRRYLNQFEARIDPKGRPYYWLHGEIEDDGNGNDSDVDIIKTNYVSITPITFDLTNYQLLRELQKIK